MNEFLEIPLKIVTLIGLVDTIVLIVLAGYALSLWVRGISPALTRLGNGLAKRKIAIFAKGDYAGSLKDLLTDSGLFKEKNIIEIANSNDLGKSERASIFLVFWPDWFNEIDEILSKKNDGSALIVYAPYDKGRIPEDQMKKIDGSRNTSVSNFRGRLLNDIVTAMITTSFK